MFRELHLEDIFTESITLWSDRRSTVFRQDDFNGFYYFGDDFMIKTPEGIARQNCKKNCKIQKI